MSIMFILKIVFAVLISLPVVLIAEKLFVALVNDVVGGKRG